MTNSVSGANLSAMFTRASSMWFPWLYNLLIGLYCCQVSFFIQGNLIFHFLENVQGYLFDNRFTKMFNWLTNLNTRYYELHIAVLNDRNLACFRSSKRTLNALTMVKFSRGLLLLMGGGGGAGA